MFSFEALGFQWQPVEVTDQTLWGWKCKHQDSPHGSAQTRDILWKSPEASAQGNKLVAGGRQGEGQMGGFQLLSHWSRQLRAVSPPPQPGAGRRGVLLTKVPLSFQSIPPLRGHRVTRGATWGSYEYWKLSPLLPSQLHDPKEGLHLSGPLFSHPTWHS